MESKEYNKLVNTTTITENRLTNIENKLVVINEERERGRGNLGVGD